MNRVRFDGLTIAAIVFFAFLLANLVRDQFRGIPDASGGAVDAVANSDEGPIKPSLLDVIFSGAEDQQNAEVAQLVPSPWASQGGPQYSGDPNLFIDPYDQYIVTQGAHGMSYGHYAVDITAGNGAPIKSPINGIVSSVFIDQYGNTTLVIENDRYQVLMLHGLYSVHSGEVVAIGQVVGTESNQGYTLDAYGQICTGRDCGYHTHLNIFDKSLGTNIDPFTLLSH